MERVSLGTYLQSGRERAGLSLDALANATKIPRRSLEALESERFEDLPAPVFVKGFVRAYCREVHLDPQPALELLPNPNAAGGFLPPGGESDEQPIYLTAPARDLMHGLRVSRVLLVLVAVALFIAAYIIADREDGNGLTTADTQGAPTAVERPPAAPDAAPVRVVTDD